MSFSSGEFTRMFLVRTAGTEFSKSRTTRSGLLNFIAFAEVAPWIWTSSPDAPCETAMLRMLPIPSGTLAGTVFADGFGAGADVIEARSTFGAGVAGAVAGAVAVT